MTGHDGPGAGLVEADGDGVLELVLHGVTELDLGALVKGAALEAVLVGVVSRLGSAPEVDEIVGAQIAVVGGGHAEGLGAFTTEIKQR